MTKTELMELLRKYAYANERLGKAKSKLEEIDYGQELTDEEYANINIWESEKDNALKYVTECLDKIIEHLLINKR